MEHTETPWVWHEYGATDDRTPWLEGGAEGDDAILRHHAKWPISDADKVFILHAVNSHDSLVEACRLSAKSHHPPSCPASQGRDVGDRCGCHVGAARAALADARKGE